MASADLIATSFKQQWIYSGFGYLLSVNNIFFDRAEQPAMLDGFPYMEMFIKQTSFEVVTQIGLNNSIAKYDLEIDVWTCEGQTGGATSGDQVIDQGTLMRAVATALVVPPNEQWNALEQLLHIVPRRSAGTEPKKYEKLYNGHDVWKSCQYWEILCRE